MAWPDVGPTRASRIRDSARRLGLRLDRTTLLLALEADTDLHEVAHDLFDVAADIADLGEFRRLDLEKRRSGELGQSTGDLGLAAAGRADHQDVLRRDFLAQWPHELLTAPAVPQGNSDRTLGIMLADDEPVEFRDDFAGRESCHHAPVECGS